MKKIWLDSYPAGVSAEADIDAFRSISHMFERSVANFAHRPAYISMGTTLTYTDLDRLSGRFASYLQNTLQVRHGTRIALMLPNLLQYPVAMFGILRAGCTVVNCNPLYTPRELNHQLRDSGAEAIVVFENRAFVLQEALQGTDVRSVVVTQVGDLLSFPRRAVTNFAIRTLKRMVPAWHIPGATTFHAALRAGARQKFSPVDVAPDDL
ncbi:MAG TPA: AMP-binding protein, partial [Acetobacteraceae bacterium]|nr:AMP-binding protein [Acetobacteraceae bacterium]